VGLPESDIQQWLRCLADHIKHSVTEGAAPSPAVPATHWEWHARFPETAQLLGGWFSQDLVDEFPDHDAAVADYAATTDPHLVAHLVGELHELLALPLDEGDYALAAAELGMEVGPPPEPFSYGAWFQAVAATLTAADRHVQPVRSPTKSVYERLLPRGEGISSRRVITRRKSVSGLSPM
jgi:hypothetical protein